MIRAIRARIRAAIAAFGHSSPTGWSCLTISDRSRFRHSAQLEERLEEIDPPARGEDLLQCGIRARDHLDEVAPTPATECQLLVRSRRTCGGCFAGLGDAVVARWQQQTASVHRSRTLRTVPGSRWDAACAQAASANATASAPAGRRMGQDGSVAARQTASATSRARVMSPVAPCNLAKTCAATSA